MFTKNLRFAKHAGHRRRKEREAKGAKAKVDASDWGTGFLKGIVTGEAYRVDNDNRCSFRFL